MQRVNDIQLEMKYLNYNYIFHFIYFIFVFGFHLFLYYSIHWFNKIIILLFILGSSFIILFILFPIIPIVLLRIKNFKLKLANIFKKITQIFLILSISIGIMISIIFCINTKYSITFCKECPFSYTLSHINFTFSKYFGKMIPYKEKIKKCNIKRCLLYNTNLKDKYAYKYLCNYSPVSELIEDKNNIYKRTLPNGSEIISSNEIICYSLNSKNMILFNNDNNYTLYNYLNICYYSTKFYNCERLIEPEIYYKIKDEDTCPNENYLFILYILCLFIIIIDGFISMFPWCVEYSTFSNSFLFINSNNKQQNSCESTRKSTQNSNNIENFKKEPTIIIIRPLTKEIKNNNIMRIKNSENHKKEINIKKKDKKEIDNKIINIRPINIGESDRIWFQNKIKEIKIINGDIKKNDKKM